ncbi:MAG: tetratricopeptide repeat protein [Eubacteriales bacterium]|nr:tetratricopeptide repeat protein [Eubacteriales bacterium]
MIWKILEIEKTKDEDVIKAAYRKKLRYVNPEDDAEGFKELRQAYDEAMEYASMPEELEEHSQEQVFKGKKTDVDLWIDRIDLIYVDVAKRRDVACWETLLHDPVCDDLDTELEAAEKLLVYFMSHSYMPQAVWQAVEQRFHYKDSLEQLKERFPENYLDYVMWQIDHPGFIDYDMFDGVTNSHVDDYISTLYEEKNAFDEGDVEGAKKHLKTLLRYDVTHPFTQVEEARHLMKEDKLNEALSIMEDLDFEYSDNPYIERVYADVLLQKNEVEKARNVYEHLLEVDADNFSAALGRAKCTFLDGSLEDAKEMVEDILEDRVQEMESMQLLDEINEKLVTRYQSELEEQKDVETCYKLGWCYYQQKEFEKGIALLDDVEESEEYDYVNLRCRLYLANEDYEKAYPLTKKWLTLIEETTDDGTKDMQKRKNRLSLAYFSIGICMYEIAFQKKEEQKDTPSLNGENDWNAEFAEGERYIERAIEEEKNVLVRLSYMEQLAKFYIAREKYEACIEICDQILATDKGFYPAYVHRQRANYELKNAKEVIDDYFACKEIYPGYSVPYVLAAEVFMAFEQYEDVENIIQAAKEVNLESDGLTLYEIKCLHYKNFSPENVRKAIEQIESLIGKVEKKTEEEFCDIEKKSELYRELAILYWDLDMTEKALDILEESIGKVSDAKELLYLETDILGRSEKYGAALRVCEQLIALDPDNLAYPLKRGNLYERMNKTQDAIACYKAILDINENYVPAIRRLMYIYSYLSNEERDLEKCRIGIEYATKLIALTDQAEGYVERGNLYIDLYELEKAVDDCKEAIKRDTDAYYAYNNLGCALLKLRRIDEAIEPLEQLIQNEPDKDYLPYLNLADCYVLKKQYDQAIRAYENVMRIKKGRGDSVDYIEKEIADIYCMKKEYEKAAAIYQKNIDEIKKKTGLFTRDESGKLQLKGKMTRDMMDRLIQCQCDLGDVYRQIGNEKLAESLYKEAEKNFFKGEFFCNPKRMEEVAEYYRDKGDLNKALYVMRRLRAKEMEVGRERYQTYLVMSTILYLQGAFEDAKKYADRYIKEYMETFGGEQGLKDDIRYLPARLYNIAIMHVCARRYDKAKAYIAQIPQCKLCVMCTSCDCFEYYFCMGMIAKAEGREEEALTFFKKAKEINEDYPCCEYQIRSLGKK